MHHAHEIDVYHALEQRCIGFGKRRGFGDTSIGNEDIDGLPRRGSGDRRADDGLIGDVGNIGEVRLTRCQRFIQHCALAAEHRDSRASTRQVRGDGPANATAATRHQRMRRTRQSGHALAPRNEILDHGAFRYILCLKLLQESGEPVSILSMIKFMTTQAGRLVYEVAGDPADTPLVFLHGIGGAARAWRGQISAFSDCYHAIAWEMPGYGGSAPLERVDIATLADTLQDFLQQIGASRPVLVGHSIGGMIVQQWLTKYPRAAAAVVLAQTSPAFGKAEGDWQKQFIEARLGPLDRGETMKTLAPSLVKELVGDNPDADGMRVARDCMASVTEASYRAMMLALL